MAPSTGRGWPLLLLAAGTSLYWGLAEDAGLEEMALDDECAETYSDDGCAVVALQRVSRRSERAWQESWPLPRLLRAEELAVPGARAWVSQKGLDFLGNQILPEFVASLPHAQFDNTEGRHGGIDYTLSNIHVASSSVSDAALRFTEGTGVELCLEGLVAELWTNWHAEWSFLWSEGLAKVSIPNGKLCGLLKLGVSPLGHPTVALADLQVNLELGKIEFTRSSFRWLYTALAWLFKRRLQEMVTTAITERLSDLVSKDLSRRLERADLKILLPLEEIRDSLLMDLSLLSIKTESSFLEADVRGSMLQPSRPGLEYPILPHAVPSSPPPSWSESPMTISISKWMLESGIWFLHRNGILSYTVVPEDVPENVLGLALSTGYLQFMVPGLAEAYPSSYNMTVTVATGSEPPSLSFEAGAVALQVPMLFTFETLLPNGTSEFAFVLHSTVNGTGSIWIEDGLPQILRANITILDASPPEQGRSAVGAVDLAFAAQLMEVVKLPAEKALNNGPLAGGVMLGTSDGGFVLANTTVDLSESGVRVFSGVGLNVTRAVDALRDVFELNNTVAGP